MQNAISPFTKAAFGVTVSPDGKRFIVAGREGKIEVYDLMNRHLHSSVVDHMVLALGFTPDGSLGVSLTAEGALRTHDPDTWEVKDTIALPFRCGFMAFNADGDQIAVGGAGPHVLLYDLASKKQIGSLGAARRTQGVIFSDDGASIIVNSTIDSFTGIRSEVRVLNRNNGSTHSYPSDTKELQRLVRSHDSKHFASVSTAGRIEIFQRSDGRLLRRWTGSDRFTQMALFVPGSSQLIVGSPNGFEIYDVSEPEPILSLQLPEAADSYDAAWIPGTNEFVVVHTRPDKQLTRWRLGRQSELTNTQQTASPHMDDTSRTKIATHETTAMDAEGQREPQRGVVAADEIQSEILAIARAERTWTSVVGTTLRATWVGNDSESVLLRENPGRERVVPRNRLSADDNDFLQQIDQTRIPADSADLSDRSQDYREYRIDSLSTALDVSPGETGGAQPAKGRGVVERINDLAVDSFGTVWLATEFGLVNFGDDYQCRLIATTGDAGIDENDRRGFGRIAIDRFDRVLVIPGNRSGNFEAGPLLQFDGKNWKQLPSIDGDRFWDVARVGKQIVAVGDFDGIAKWDNESWQVHPQHVFDDARRFSKIEVSRDGLTLAKSESRESLLWNRRAFIDLRPQITKSIANPQWRPSGELLFQNRDISGMWKLCELNTERTDVRILYSAEKDRSRALYSFMVGSDNAIWISTAEGLFRLHGNSRKRWLNPVNGLLPLPDGRLMTTFGGGRHKLQVLSPVDTQNRK